MLSFLFLASVANANNAFSASNEIVAAAQRFTSQLKAEMYFSAQNGRRLSSTKPCEWLHSKCDLSQQFALQSGQLEKYPDTKAFLETSKTCEAIKAKADCEKNAKCQFQDNKCWLSDQEGSKFMMKVMKIEKCGEFVKAAMAPPPADDCNKKDKAGCTAACEWQEEYNFDDKKCKDESKCVTKHVHNPKDPFGIKTACPKMKDTEKDACDKKTDFKEKLDCFIPICPHAVGVTAALACMGAKDATACTKAADVCVFDSKKGCAMDTLKFLDMLIPDTCAMKPMFTQGTICGGGKPKAECEKNKQCKFGPQSYCDKTTVKSRDGCGAVEVDLMAGMAKEMMGAKLEAQMKKCGAAKDTAACGKVAADKDLIPTTTALSMGAVPAISTLTTFLVGFLVAP